MNKETFRQLCLQFFTRSAFEFCGDEVSQEYVSYMTTVELPFTKFEIHWIPNPYDNSGIKFFVPELKLVFAQLILQKNEVSFKITIPSDLMNNRDWTVFIDHLTTLVESGKLEELPESVHILEYAGLLAQLMCADPLVL